MSCERAVGSVSFARTLRNCGRSLLSAVTLGSRFPFLNTLRRPLRKTKEGGISEFQSTIYVQPGEENMFRFSWIFAALLMSLVSAASAQTYPTRPITLIVPFAPGAISDIAARILREPMSQQLGQPIVIENRPGAAGTVAVNGVVNAAPDGYTIVLTSNAVVTMNKYLQKNFPFDPEKQLAPISNILETSLFLAVNSSLPVTTVSELVAYAKQHPGKLSYGSAGIGSAHHIAGELINQKAGVQIQHVPYRGSGPAVQDLVAGHIPISFGTAPAMLPQSKAGTIRLIAAVESKRDPELPDLPTVAETLPGVVTATWVGIYAPAGTPPSIIDKLNKAAVAALKQPDVLEKLKIQGARPVGSSPDELSRLVKAELESWGKIILASGIQRE
jgi:tripartite-type tricarboxylate transporter receptor subunit TctC